MCASLVFKIKTQSTIITQGPNFKQFQLFKAEYQLFKNYIIHL